MAEDQPIAGENVSEASVQNDPLHSQNNNSWNESFGLHNQVSFLLFVYISRFKRETLT